MKVIIEKELEPWWGVDDLLEDMTTATDAEKEAAIVELLNEDISALLNGASWRIEK